ncbi:MAG TPA: septum formation initiator family protein [Pyrinomonadaceae bacterium]|nr:septum formation initiator family protein [Pyrinomonadaceae bacterium]
MNKVAITYWDNTKAISLPAANRVKPAKRAESVSPQWLVFTVVASMTLMLCMAINLRAYSEMSAEMQRHELLSVEIEQLNNENLAIQEEIHNLKTDARIIEREARRIGMSRPIEKVLVSVD